MPFSGLQDKQAQAMPGMKNTSIRQRSVSPKRQTSHSPIDDDDDDLISAKRKSRSNSVLSSLPAMSEKRNERRSVSPILPRGQSRAGMMTSSSFAARRQEKLSSDNIADFSPDSEEQDSKSEFFPSPPPGERDESSPLSVKEGDEQKAPRRKVGYSKPNRSPDEVGSFRKPSSDARVAVLEQKLKDVQEQLKEAKKLASAARQAETAAISKLRQVEHEQAHMLKERDAKLLALQQKLNDMTGLSENKFEVSKEDFEGFREKLTTANNVIAALKSKLGALQEQKTALEQTLNSKSEECEMLKRRTDDVSTESQQDRKSFSLAKDKLALTIARQEALQKSWDAKRAEMETKLLEKDKKLDELKGIVSSKDKEILDLKDEVLRNLWKPDSSSRSTQTERSVNKWLWLLTLKIMTMNERDMTRDTASQTETVRIDGVVTGKAKLVTKSTMTAVSTQDDTLSEQDQWWNEILKRCEQEVRIFDLKREIQMPEQQLLVQISSIYAEKAIIDFIDRQKERPLQNMQEFLFMYFLRECRGRQKAEVALVRLLTNILIKVRGREKKSGAREIPRSAYRHRIGLFARFLGFDFMEESRNGVKVEKHSISLDGLEVFLNTLVLARQGICPLLESGMRTIQVKTREFLAALDYVFSNLTAVERERIKTDIYDSLNVGDEMDLEAGLETVIEEWLDMNYRMDSRLEALFVAADVAGDGDVDWSEFQSLVKRLDEDHISNDVLRQLRIYTKIYMWPRVDSGVFCKVARDHDLSNIKISPDFERNAMQSPELERSSKRLQPLFRATSEAIKENLKKISNHPMSPDLFYKWDLCERVMNEKKYPEMAWVIFHQSSRSLTQILKEVQTNEEDEEDEEEEAAEKPSSPSSFLRAASSPRRLSPLRSPRRSTSPINRRTSVAVDPKAETEKAEQLVESLRKKSSPRARFASTSEVEDDDQVKRNQLERAPSVGRRMLHGKLASDF
mmetsp:Transcript_51977/g.161664  ORF Transcript_51977/g.161664 Transcript_51977/m.161664 type:complete len:966 (-) Transcript_51977:90-2987(-)